MSVRLLVDERLFTFDEILRSEPYVLSDGEPTRILHNDWYRDGVYRANSLSQLNAGILSYVAEGMVGLQEWFANPNVHSVDKVVDEIDRFRQIIHDKLVRLNVSEDINRLSKSKKRRKQYECVGRETDVETNRNLLEAVCFGYVNVVRIARHDVFIPEDPVCFSKFEQAVVDIAAKKGAKTDLKPVYCGMTSSCADLHADESLVASALYRSVFYEQGSCIVSPDSDISRILNSVYMEMQGTEWKDCVNDRLKANPVRVYFVLPKTDKHAGSVCLAADTADIVLKQELFDKSRKKSVSLGEFRATGTDGGLRY